MYKKQRRLYMNILIYAPLLLLNPVCVLYSGCATFGYYVSDYWSR